MSKAITSIAYDGPALRGGTMDVRDLAPALLAVGQLFDAANSALNGESARINVQVTATESGSFQIGLEVAQSIGEHLVALLTSAPVVGAGTLVTLVFGTPASRGLIAVINALKGKKPSKIEKFSDSTIKITFDGDSFEVPIELLKLYQDMAVRVAMQKLIQEPLLKDGIELFEAREKKKGIVSINKSEASNFERPHVPDEMLVDHEITSAYSIISLAFKEENKWRLNDGSNPISATIADEDFLRRVDNNQISFSKGDILICDVRVTQKQTDQGLKTEYFVLKVKDHRTGARQLPLPLPTPPSKGERP